MDFLDPKKRHRHKIRLITGYILIALALALATTILLYQAFGYGIDKKGQIVQNGLVFASSRPSGADILVNGAPYGGKQTNTRLQLPAGQYTLRLQRNGYRPWERAVTVNGNDVQHFDYTLLVPTTLTNTLVKQYDGKPSLVSQSPDRHWLVVQASPSSGEFELYNLAKPKEPPLAIALPPDVLSSSDGPQGWQEVEWSDDNRHALLKHLFQKNGQPPDSEYILLDRQNPLQSLNLTKALNLNPTKIALRDKAYNQYYLFDQATGRVSRASLRTLTPAPYLDHVLNFAASGSDVVLYVTDQGAPAGKANVRLRQGDKTYPIRQVAASQTYLLDLAQYSGDWYMVAGSAADAKIYIYKNPADTFKSATQKAATPFRVLRIDAPTYVSFSKNAQFLLAEGGGKVAVYDAENKQSYAYQLKEPLDAPQQHVSWMDSDRLLFVSGGKAIMVDYDGTNQQTLSPADPSLGVVFDPDYKAAYEFAAAGVADKPNLMNLTTTPLLNPADQ